MMMMMLMMMMLMMMVVITMMSFKITIDALLTDSWTLKNFFFSLVAESHMEWLQVCNMSALPHLGRNQRKNAFAL